MTIDLIINAIDGVVKYSRISKCEGFKVDELENSVYLPEYNAIITCYSDKVVVYSLTKVVRTVISHDDLLVNIVRLIYYIAVGMYKMIELK